MSLIYRFIDYYKVSPLQILNVNLQKREKPEILDKFHLQIFMASFMCLSPLLWLKHSLALVLGAEGEGDKSQNSIYGLPSIGAQSGRA